MSGDGFSLGLWFITLGVAGYVVSATLSPDKFLRVVAVVCFIAGLGMMLGIIPINDKSDTSIESELVEEFPIGVLPK